MTSPARAFEHREELTAISDALATRYWRNDPIEDLLAAWSNAVDAVIERLYDTHLAGLPVAAFAVGGYGRGELHPGSDIDVLVLAEKPQKHQRQIELFLQGLFDLNMMEVGHSVRTPKACRDEARSDITVATALFERRFLVGDQALIERLDKFMGGRRLWPADRFFQAKYDEQLSRHREFNNVEYNLEPNIKASPGGLRDIHTALWICRRQFGTTDPEKLVELEVLTPTEARWLVEGRRFIWWVRWGLHLVAGRKEDRLQFAFQRELSQRLGFVDTDAQLGVERFMHHYYRHVLELTEVNDILIQHFREVIMTSRRRTKTEPINDRFQLTNGYIEATDDHVFIEHPASLLEMFVIMANRTDVDGVRAATIRLIRNHLHLIDDSFLKNPEHTRLFLELLKAPNMLVSTLTRMRRYGILGRYIPEFGQVIGRMQHDLFHIYTVDAHTMMVIRNMRRFRYRASREAYPVAYHCVHTVPKIELLYIAGLYHDIGKGRGGDHSKLGAIDANRFCERHAINEADTDLVCWLVDKHLYMSSVAQREDIYDPDVVHAFASEVKSEMRLDYLYALTVADINATNPTLWNSWRATLLHQLYMETRKMLRRGLESPADKQAALSAHQERARERLLGSLDDDEVPQIDAIWRNLGEDFFLRHSPGQIANLTVKLINHKSEHPDMEQAFITLDQTRGDLPGEGATQIYVYCLDQPRLFATTVITLSGLQISIVDAIINTSDEGVCFDIYTVLGADGEPIRWDSPLRDEVQTKLQHAIDNPNPELQPARRRLPRQVREMTQATEVTLNRANGGASSTITVLASDRPGLLATIAMLFVELGLQLLSAKITTLGARVEDTFVVQNTNGEPIGTGQSAYEITHAIRQRIDRHMNQV